MPEEVSKHRTLTEKLIKAGFKSVEELIKVAEAPIIKKVDFTDDLAVEKMKNAAAAKKLAIFDAYDILDKIKDKQEELDKIDGKPTEKEAKAKTSKIPSAESIAN